MPTERLLIFDEAGNAKRVKARLTRFLENEPVTSTEKSAMRDTLGITGTSGDLISSNNLSDVASKDTAKLNLEVINVGSASNQVPLCGMLNSGAWLDFDAFYEEGIWTPTLSYSGGSTGIAYGANTFGYYTKIGNTVNYSGYLTLTNKGSSSGYVYLHVPFAAASATDSHQSGLTFGITSGMASLTSVISGVYLQNDSRILLYDSGATGTNALSEANLTGASELRFSGTYQIA